MTDHQQFIHRRLEHQDRMAGYLEWSLNQVKAFVPIKDWTACTQEHTGKSMRAIAIEEEHYEPFGAALAFMEKLGVLDSMAHWKLIREPRNAVNLEYGDNPARLSEFFRLLTEEAPMLLGYAKRLKDCCCKNYMAE